MRLGVIDFPVRAIASERSRKWKSKGKRENHWPAGEFRFRRVAGQTFLPRGNREKKDS
jgi:hypothetical protein